MKVYVYTFGTGNNVRLFKKIENCSFGVKELHIICSDIFLVSTVQQQHKQTICIQQQKQLVSGITLF